MAHQWYIKSGGKEHGPCSSAQLKKLAEQGRITPDSQVRRGEVGKWLHASKVKGLFPATESPRQAAEKLETPQVKDKPIVAPHLKRETSALRLVKSAPYVWGGIAAAALLLISVISYVVFSDGDSQTTPAPEVIAAWEKAGAELGWISQSGTEVGAAGFLLRWQRNKPVAGDVPAFRFSLFPTGKLNVLPPPEVPFGLSFDSVTDAGLKELAGLTQLQTLTLGGTQVTDAGLKELAGLTQLQALNLYNTKVTDAGLKELAGLTQLQTLNLDNTKVTDAGLKELAGLTQLQSLGLSRTQVTDAGLKELAGLKQLRELGLFGTQVTDVGVRELRQASPQVQIFR